MRPIDPRPVPTAGSEDERPHKNAIIFQPSDSGREKAFKGRFQAPAETSRLYTVSTASHGLLLALTSRRPVPPAAERRSEASFLIDALGPASSLSCMITWNVAGSGLQL